MATATGRTHSESGIRYVPIDYEGEQGPCRTCGNDAPERTVVKPEGGLDRWFECSPCFVGRVCLGVVTEHEARVLRSSVLREVRR